MMLPTLFTTTFLFAIFALRARADCFVATVSLTQCQPATLTWEGGIGPYDVVTVLASNPCGDIVHDFGLVDDKSLQWDKVNVASGTTLMVSVLDQNGDEGWSGSMTVQPSGDSSCLPPQNTTASSPSPDSPNYPSPSPTTTTTSSKTPTATVVGAANNGIMNSGTSVMHLSGMAVAFTAFCALIALL